MILIALSWTYILFTSVNLGVLFQKLFKLKNDNFAITVFLGLFSATILASLWAFAGRINWEFHIVLVLMNVMLALKFGHQIAAKYRQFLTELRLLPPTLKIALIAITLVIIAQCAAPPYIVDNESYYIQTVKWLNEYGFVKGLANLHYFFGQTSGWHITQSAFSFSFLYPDFNDLSGFCLMIGNVFAIQKLGEYDSSRNRDLLVIGLLPLANVFFCRFIGAPAPDIAIYVLSFIIFWLFIKHYSDKNVDGINLVLILVLFAIYIKPTAVALVLLPLFLMLRNRSYSSVSYRVPLLSIIILVLYVGKNLILTGYPLFPFPIRLADWAPQHQVPEEIVQYFSENRSAAFQLSNDEFTSMSIFEIFIKWLMLPGLDGLFNKLALLLILVAPLMIVKFFNRREYWLLYLAMVVQLALLFLLSPQYRFFFNFMLFFIFLFVSPLVRNRMLLNIPLFVSIFATSAILLFPFSFAMLTDNELAKESQTFTAEMIIAPAGNSKSAIPFEKVGAGNLQYYSPTENSFLWQTGNGQLPCVNKYQVEFFDRYFSVTPQLITTDLGDGFYSKKTSQ